MWACALRKVTAQVWILQYGWLVYVAWDECRCRILIGFVYWLVEFLVCLGGGPWALSDATEEGECTSPQRHLLQQRGHRGTPCGGARLAGVQQTTTASQLVEPLDDLLGD